MSVDLRAVLAELAETEVPEAAGLPPGGRLAAVKLRARSIRRRRLAGRALAAAAVAAVAVGVVQAPRISGVEPAEPPFPGTERLGRVIEGRALLASTAVEVDGDPVRLVVTPPDVDVQVRFFCSRQDEVALRISVAGGSPRLAGGCEDAAHSTSRPVEDWAAAGLRPGRPSEITLSAVSTRPPTPAELETPTWAFVGIYATPPSTLPAVPAPVPGTAGSRLVATRTLDADHLQAPLVLTLPASRRVLYAASCAGPADGLTYMIHAGEVMIGQGSCRFPGSPAPLELAALPKQDGDLVAEVILEQNHGEDVDQRPPRAGARVVVSFYVSRTG